jgi:hypothetical protein
VPADVRSLGKPQGGGDASLQADEDRASDDVDVPSSLEEVLIGEIRTRLGPIIGDVGSRSIVWSQAGKVDLCYAREDRGQQRLLPDPIET